MDAREVALLTLSACQRQGAWSDGHLKKAIREAGLDSRDGALATTLCFGVLQNQMLLDFYLDCFSKVKTGKMEEKVRLALRLGVYQMLFLDRIPVSAAVNTAVDLVRKYSKNPRSAGLANGVLRTIARQESLPEPVGDPVQRLAVRYSHPEWLTQAFLERLGPEETEALLMEDNGRPPIYAQVNPIKTDVEGLTDRLEREGVTAQSHTWLEGCLTLSGTGDLEQLPSFREGLFTIQDPAARLTVLAAGPRPGMRVLDVCAAPGGKSFACAVAMGNEGEIVSCDIHTHKRTLIEKGALRLGLSCVSARTLDARSFEPEYENAFDLVLADVPCSGLGVIRKKPDIRYKDPKPLTGLPAVQKAILANVSSYVKPGGVLMYSTCTVLERENEAVIQDFLGKHSDFEPEAFRLPGPVGEVSEGMCTLWPHRHGTDGFFLCKLRRKGGGL